ncbi:MAG: hypothetical protein OEV43_04180 [Coriobacteriia bacterium]|nr:hypothetical protein [Coriobacteriia bacterium]
MELLARTCSTERMNVERIIARLFVAAGGVFWGVAAFGADYSYQGKPLAESAGSAAIPLLIAAVALAIGWFYEGLAGAGLIVGSVGIVVWGLLAEWESGVWLVNAVVLIAPMVIGGVLYLLAARMQRICALEEAASG